MLSVKLALLDLKYLSLWFEGTMDTRNAILYFKMTLSPWEWWRKDQVWTLTIPGSSLQLFFIGCITKQGLATNP